MRRSSAVGLVAVLIVGVTVVGLGLLAQGAASTDAQEVPGLEADISETVPVSRRTLERSEEFEARVGYGDVFALPGFARGTITWVPSEGTILEPGDVLYKVDELPTLWTTGEVPMYRTLQRGTKGDDVEQLQRYLLSEGLLEPDYEIDGEFDRTLRDAVKSWQDEHGLERTGSVDASQLLFFSADGFRVGGAPRVGDQATGGVLDVTLPDLYVSAEVSARQKRVFEGDPVIEVELADGSAYRADVGSIDAVESQDPFGEQRFRIRLEIDAPVGQRPGDATVTARDVLVEDALTVPVSALVALLEGGYAVEVQQADGVREYRSVEIGEFADGWVSVTGDVSEGDNVVVPT